MEKKESSVFLRGERGREREAGMEPWVKEIGEDTQGHSTILKYSGRNPARVS